MKRILCIVFCAVMLFCTVPSVCAAGSETEMAAEALHILGLFSGSGTDAAGHPIYALDRVPTRMEAITMLVRLLGKEKEATSGNWSIPFTDVDDWAKPYVGYAYENRLTVGIGSTTFGNSDPVSAAQYLTFILRALGYESGTDFEWSRAWELTDRLGITGGEYNADASDFLRGDVVNISLHALPALRKGTYQTLAQKLMDEAVFSQAQYDEVLQITGISKADPRQNLAMVNQMGNLKTGGNCVETQDRVYYLYKARDVNGAGENTSQMFIISRTDDGVTEKVHTADKLGLLSTDVSGAVFFVEDNSKLRSYDPNTEKLSTLFTDERHQILTYLFYDGNVYFLDRPDGINAMTTYRIMRFDGQKLKTLVTGTYETLNDATAMYAYNGKLYYPFGNHKQENEYGYFQFYDCSLYALDLTTGKTESVIRWNQAKISEDVAFYEDTMWLLSDDWKSVQKISLTDPSQSETIATISEAGGFYPLLYANGKMVYYQVSGTRKVWRILPNGTVTEVIVAPTAYYEASFVNRQGAAVMGLPDINSLLSGHIQIETEGEQHMTFPQFLGFPYATDGWNIHAAVETASFAEAEELNSCRFVLTRAYRDAEDNLIVELCIDNQESGQVELNNTILDLRSTDAQVHCCVEGDVDVSAGQTKEVSLVIPQEYSRDLALDSLHISARWKFMINDQGYYHISEYTVINGSD